MNTKELLELSLFLEFLLTIVVLATMVYRGSQRIFSQLSALLLVECCTVAATIGLLYFRKSLHLTADVAWLSYWAVGWISSGVILILRVLIVYSVFAEAIRPMAGLHQAGKMIFRWVGVVSGLVAFALLAGPGVFSSRTAWLDMLSHLQLGVSVLTLCLLVFVCFAVRPLGLTFRSHIFGVSLGLGIAASVELVQSAWLLTAGARSVYSPIYLFSSTGFCAAALVWGVYFAAPEPPRKMILLPTTSPFFFWNRISEILGDSPGHVAVAGFTPSMLAPAEIEMLTAATSADSVPRTVPPAALSFGTDALPPPDLAAATRPSLAL